MPLGEYVMDENFGESEICMLCLYMENIIIIVFGGKMYKWIVNKI